MTPVWTDQDERSFTTQPTEEDFCRWISRDRTAYSDSLSFPCHSKATVLVGLYPFCPLHGARVLATSLRGALVMARTPLVTI